MPKPIIIIKDEVNCKLQHFDKSTINELNKKFEYMHPNARFNPKFELGIWDGKISFVSKSGETYINLLRQILSFLLKKGIKFDVVDQRIPGTISLDNIDENLFSHILHPATNEPFILRPYQVEAVNVLLNEKGGILLAATGAGKTSITAAICHSYNKLGKKSLVIVPNVDLVKQTRETLELCGLDVGELSGSVKEFDHITVISTWQTLQNMPYVMKEFEMVICDEAHGASGYVIQSLLGEHGKHIKYRYGLTGTLPKDDISSINVHNVLGDVKYTITARYLIDNGYLADLHIVTEQLNENLKSQYDAYLETAKGKKVTYATFKNKYFPDYATEKTFLRTNPARLSYIADRLIAESKEGNVFALIDNITFGNRLKKIINEKFDNEDVYFVSGKDKRKARKSVYDLFKTKNNIICIATVQCAGVGTDIARIYKLFMIDLGKSFIRTIQAVGRGLRTAKDKKYLDVIDISSDFKYSKRHMSERIKYYKEAEYPHSKKSVTH